ncbi:S8 family serine peptidase [Spirosoma sp. KCTC 42546]|uniref:S8 family peptidase n=1 Tax=Spirosoma sp. KCTC 42546 TaxID=2520506 RepID=UPI00115A9ACD|nr:S8 family peptidase [Spirosoma sp. KCTC 42546]QDK82469.1 S8 family serine peptidase [Spirosoma sp. KCTC 42546]
MHLRKTVQLFIPAFLFILTTAQAQLPIRGTQWKGIILTPDALNVLLSFRDDTMVISTETDHRSVETMQYDQTGDTLSLQKIEGQSSCNTTSVGTYRLIYTNNGEGFQLQLLSDNCPQRQEAFSSTASFIRLRPNPTNQPPRNWPYLDPKNDSVAGISLYRAYELLAGRKSVPVVVGVLDSGVDLTHEDLRDVVWVNPKEIPGNSIDDDKNGYTDDLNGWNFMGAKDGTTYEYDQPEITQTYVILRTKYDKLTPATASPNEKRQYETYQTAKKQFLQRYKTNLPKYLAFADTAQFWRITQQIESKLPTTVTTSAAIRAIDFGTDSVAVAVQTILAEAYLPQYGPFSSYVGLVRKNWTRFRQIMGSEADIAYNPDYNPRKTVGDNPANPTERYYGSPTMLIGQSQQLAMHGSHVAGIIAAKRGNGRGIDGVADNVRIMPVSVVPSNGDERDKDVANGILYAVENGAKVINMSFGKRLSPFKEQVDAAIRFAEEHDVLIVHAAGNNGENYDSLPAFPSARYESGELARNVLVVGNSTWRVGQDLPSRSSNYGAQTVDVFAPGTAILSTLPHNRYASLSGTSMASPMTAGVAALLRSYFPKLTAVQVKEILMRSSYQPDVTVRKPGRSAQQVPFKNLSRSGGLLNAYEAVKMAMEVK